MLSSAPALCESALDDLCDVTIGYPPLSQFVCNALESAHLGVPLVELVELAEVVLYLDTVRYFFPCRIPRKLRPEICSWISLGLLRKYYGESKDCADWERGELRIHQPKLELLARADEVVRRYDGRLLGFDIAVDLVPRDPRDVSVLRDWILARATLFRAVLIRGSSTGTARFTSIAGPGAATLCCTPMSSARS
jgi:hypothetical protein